jgi:hypothetical protein
MIPGTGSGTCPCDRRKKQSDMACCHIYVDETKKCGYVLVASTHATTEITSLHDIVRDLLLPGQRYLHMKDEKDGRKRTIADAFVRAGVLTTIYRAGPQHRTERARRSACLRALVEDHAVAGARIIFDQDDSMLSWDNQKLIEFTRATDCRDRLSYEHRKPHSELLLAVPDAIAWCWAKGGKWRTLVAPTVAAVRDV